MIQCLEDNDPNNTVTLEEVKLLLTVCDEMTFFLSAAQRQTSSLTACADPFNTGVQSS